MEKARKEFEKLNKKIDYLTDKMIDKLDAISREINKAKQPAIDEGEGQDPRIIHSIRNKTGEGK
jgi:hypothetical protein